MKKEFRLKRLLRVAAVTVLLQASLLLTACLPSGYTNDAVKSMKNEYNKAAKEWFSENMPEAEVESSAPYKDGRDLFMAIEGTYRKDKRLYNFLYDFESGIMYLDEYDDEISRLIKTEVSKVLGVSEDMLFVRINHHFLELTSANDRANKEYGHIPYGEKGKVDFSYYPYKSEPADIAKDALFGENPGTEFAVEAYVDEIPDYDPAVINSLAGFGYVSYHCPMEPVYQGIEYATYYRDMASQTLVHMEKVEDNMYAGYTYTNKITVNEDGTVVGKEKIRNYMGRKVGYEKGEDGKFNVTIPVDTDLLLLAPKNKYIDCYTDGNSVPAEDEMYESDSNESEFFKGYRILGAQYILPDTKLRIYTCKWSRKSKDGVYTIKKK